MKAKLLSAFLFITLALSGCNTVKGTFEGAGKDLQSITPGKSNTNQNSTSHSSSKKTYHTSTYQNNNGNY